MVLSDSNLLILLIGTIVSAGVGGFTGVLGGFRTILGMYRRRLALLHRSRLVSPDSREISSVLERIMTLIGFGQSLRPTALIVSAPTLVVVVGALTILNSNPTPAGSDFWFLQATFWATVFLTGILAGFTIGDFAANITTHNVLLESVLLPTEYTSGVIDGALKVLGRLNILRELLGLFLPRRDRNFSEDPPTIGESGSGGQTTRQSLQGNLSRAPGFVECASCKRAFPEDQISRVTESEPQDYFPVGTMLCHQCFDTFRFGMSQPSSAYSPGDLGT